MMHTLRHAIARRHIRSAAAVIAVLALGAAGCSTEYRSAISGPGATGDGLAYVNEIVDTMQAHSIRQREIDWASFRWYASIAVPAGAGISQTYGAIQTTLAMLDDSHTAYHSATGVTLYLAEFACDREPVVATPTVDADIGYVRIPAFSGDEASALALADSIQAAIRAADGTQLNGWIVDLRGNGGGNMWPMLAGVGPILGTGTAGYFVDAGGTATPWGYTATGAQLGGTVVQAVTAPYALATADPKVAVLVDGRVASSGEAIAIAFKNRPNTRLFGTPTCGLSTAIRTYPLSDGGYLNLADAVMADRTRAVYGGSVQPDEKVVDWPGVVMERAVAWIREP